MSITYDPKKWTDPLRARDFESTVKKSRSPVVVSLRDLRYFDENSELKGNEPVGLFVGDEAACEDVVEEEEVIGS